MLHYKQGFLGPYIAAVELPENKDVTLTIDHATIEKVDSIKEDDEQGRKRDRLIVYFRGVKDPSRGWLINRTNAECIVQMFGEDASKWGGHKVTIYRTKVRFGSKMEEGIRVKGSPELTKPIRFDLRLPRKRPQPMTLVPTGSAGATTEETQPEPASDPVEAK